MDISVTSAGRCSLSFSVAQKTSKSQLVPTNLCVEPLAIVKAAPQSLGLQLGLFLEVGTNGKCSLKPSTDIGSAEVTWPSKRTLPSETSSSDRLVTQTTSSNQAPCTEPPSAMIEDAVVPVGGDIHDAGVLDGRSDRIRRADRLLQTPATRGKFANVEPVDFLTRLETLEKINRQDGANMVVQQVPDTSQRKNAERKRSKRANGSIGNKRTGSARAKKPSNKSNANGQVQTSAVRPLGARHR